MTETMTDLKVKTQEALKADLRTNEHRIIVSEENGVVTLTGSIPSTEVGEAAVSVVKDVFGVRGVINGMEVESAN